LSHKYASGVPRELQITIGGEVVILMCLHGILLSLLLRFISVQCSAQ
jgi:hypothetical protein